MIVGLERVAFHAAGGHAVAVHGAEDPAIGIQELVEIEIRRAAEGVAIGFAEEAGPEAEPLDGLRLGPEARLAGAAALGQVELVDKRTIGLDGVMQCLVEEGALGGFGQFRPGPFAEEAEPFQAMGEGDIGARPPVGIVEAVAEVVGRDEFHGIEDAGEAEVAHGEDTVAEGGFQTRVAQADERFEVMEDVVSGKHAHGREAAAAVAPAAEDAVAAQVAGDGFLLDEPEQAPGLVADVGAPGGLLLFYLSPLPLLMVGLALGSRAVGLALASGLVLVGLVGGLSACGLYALMHALPSGLVTVRALMRRVGGANDDPEAWYPIGGILTSLTLLAMILVLAMALSLSGHAGIEAGVRGVLDQVLSVTAAGLGEEDRLRFAGALTPYFLGASAVAWLAMIVANAILAQWLLARRGWALRPTPRWSALVLPDWLTWPLVGAAAVALLASGDVSYLAHNLVVLFAAPYFFLGLAVIHQAAANNRARGVLLAAFYFAFIIFFLLAATIVAGIGIAEQWVGVRRRLRGNASNNGS